MNFTIKKAGLADLEELKSIGIASYLPHYTHLWKPGGVEWYMNRCFGEEFLKKEIADRNVEYYIIENDGESIGILKLILKKAILDSEIENALYLEKIYFVKKWTGKGIGKKLIEFSLQRAADLKRDCVWLMAMDTSEKPIAAYQKSGFEIFGRTRLDDDEFNLMKEEFRGMIILKKCLSDEK